MSENVVDRANAGIEPEGSDEREQAPPQRLPLSRYIALPMSELTTPKNGYRVILNHWWAVTDEGALFFVTPRKWLPDFLSPQCNTIRGIVDRLCPAGARVQFIPLAFLSMRGDA